MRNILKILAALLLIIVFVFNTVSCDVINGVIDKIQNSTDNDTPDGDDGQTDDRFYIDGELKYEIQVGDTLNLVLVRGESLKGDVLWTSSNSCASVEDGVVTALSVGQAVIKASLGDKSDRVLVTVVEEKTDTDNKDEDNNKDDTDGSEDDGRGDTVIVPGTDDPITSDPYENVDVEEFYENYTPAVSYMDAQYRSQHGLMSGSIEDQDQEPTISAYQPRSNGRLIRNNVYLFSEDGNTYYVVDCYGEVAFEIYKGGAYVILEEVAAYVFAFGEIPANHITAKKGSPSQSVWGKYLRLNHSKFSGDTSKYRYEPVLPNISGCGGDLTYYEMDIGTTGTDCDPGYSIVPYNDGRKITRGAARIVYSYKDKNGDNIIGLDERYVFYTYNHYNDFQEYLNYEGGWGEMFGNITGGGVLSSNSSYNPTPYVPVVRGDLKKAVETVIVYYYVPKFELVA